MESVDWLKDLGNKVFNFVLNMSENDFTYFKYSLTGDLYTQKTRWGLGQAVFVAKTLYMIDKLKEIDEFKKTNLIEFIKSFQNSDGYIYDPLITKLSRSTNFKQLLKNRDFELIRNLKTKRAETRQSYAALFCLDTSPDKPFLHIPYTENSVENYLISLDWKSPWGAGSHLCHLLFFLKNNKDMFNYQPDLSSHLINFAINWANSKLQSEKDGTWHDGEVPLYEKINGAMKILVAFDLANFYKLSYVDNLIDTVLSGVDDSHACHNFNIIFPLYYASKLTDYRKEDIYKFCLNKLSTYREFYKEKEGGFSFHRNKANDTYYNARITKGLDEPDIHGTVLYLWGITLISKVLNIQGLNFKEPIT